ncbi:MAG TPA: metallophosphoesterase, partial [Ramlibacter sp.]
GTMKLYVLSDLHNELHAFDASVHAHAWRSADVIVLAGDIGQGVDGLGWARRAFDDKPVVYVAGNHEFYGGYWERTLEDMRHAARECGIDFLENDTVEIGGIRFLGCTLWTDFDMFGQQERDRAMQQTGMSLNDYRLIKDDSLQSLYWAEVQAAPYELVPKHTRQRHLASRAWLEKELAANDPDRTVVVTHHYPSIQSCASRYRDDLVSAGFGSQLPASLLARAEVWIHGHTHDSCDYTLWHQEDDAFRETRVICNPRGYPRSRIYGGVENEAFNPELTVEVPED